MVTELRLIKMNGHHFEERSSYHVQNVDKLITDFYEIEKCKKKEICAVLLSKEICLIRQTNMEKMPRIIDETGMLFDPATREKCYQLALTLYEGVMKCILSAKEEQLESVMERAGSKWERKQEKINYSKAIKKKMLVCSKVFKDARMENYDFREIDLENALFINCSLKNANFSHVNLENTVFINCQLTGAIFYKSQINNVVVISGAMKELAMIQEGEWDEEKECLF